MQFCCPAEITIVGCSSYKSIQVQYCHIKIIIFSHTCADSREAELGTNTVLLRALKYTLMCLFVTHCMSCIWHAIACEGDHYGVTRSCHVGTWANNEAFSVGKLASFEKKNCFDKLTGFYCLFLSEC